MPRQSLRSTILMLSVAIPVIHFLVERNRIAQEGLDWRNYPPGYQPPPGYPPLPPGYQYPPGYPYPPQGGYPPQQSPPDANGGKKRKMRKAEEAAAVAEKVVFEPEPPVYQPVYEKPASAFEKAAEAMQDYNSDENDYGLQPEKPEEGEYTDDSNDDAELEDEDNHYEDMQVALQQSEQQQPVQQQPAQQPVAVLPGPVPTSEVIAEAAVSSELSQNIPEVARPLSPMRPAAPVQAIPSNNAFAKAQAALRGESIGGPHEESNMSKEEKKAIRKQQRKAERAAEKAGLPPPDYGDDEGGNIPWEQEITPYSVLEGVEGVENVLKVGPAGAEREPAPILTRPDYIEDVLMDRMPPMKREWYEDIPVEEQRPLEQYSYFLNPYDFCADQAQFMLLIIVHGPIWNFDRRKIIRQTWMGDVVKYEGDVKVIFSVSVDGNGKRQQKIREEAKLYGDILQHNVHESPENQTLKYFAGWNWADLYCPNSKYILNIQDDVVPYTEAIMTGPVHPPADYDGYRWLNCGKRILRPMMDDDFTYLLAKDELQQNKYKRQFLPATCTSHCAFMSRDIIRILLFGSVKTHLLNVPDMDLYGLIREKYALSPGIEMPGAPFLCQHLEKRGIKALEITYDFPTVEERIAAAWENTKTSPVGKHILERLEVIKKKREELADNWREL